MKTIAICIAKRGRTEQFNACMRFLDQCNKELKYNLVVYASTDMLDRVDQGYFCKNLTYCPLIVRNDGVFNKSKLLNNSIKWANVGKWDILSIVDLDMVYTENFLDIISDTIDSGEDYVVSHGFHLSSNTVDKVKACLTSEEVFKLDKVPFLVGPSQISINHKAYDYLVKVFGENIYDETFEGWGGEDSLISTASRILNRLGFIKKTQIDNMWCHMYHDKCTPNQANQDYFNIKNKEIIERCNNVS